jgi:hypothetical protein
MKDFKTYRMLHNKSHLILAGIIAALYLLYTRLSKEDKKEVIKDVSEKAANLVQNRFAV